MLDLQMMQRCIALTDPQATKTIIHLQLLSRVMAPSCASPATRRQTHFVNYSIFAGDEVQPKAPPSAILFNLTTNNKSVLRQIKNSNGHLMRRFQLLLSRGGTPCRGTSEEWISM
jgi:hypothetical protein